MFSARIEAVTANSVVVIYSSGATELKEAVDGTTIAMVEPKIQTRLNVLNAPDVIDQTYVGKVITQEHPVVDPIADAWRNALLAVIEANRLVDLGISPDRSNLDAKIAAARKAATDAGIVI
jgi:hypothetical protein